MYPKGKNDIIVRFLGGFEFCLKLRFCFTTEKGSFVSVTQTAPAKFGERVQMALWLFSSPSRFIQS